MLSKLISSAGLMALVIGIMLAFGSEGVRWIWLGAGLLSAIFLFWMAGKLAPKDD